MATNYFPDPNAVPRQLVIADAFDTLRPREKLYAHYMSRAAWHGSRIIMRQTSPESIGIFDFIMEGDTGQKFIPRLTTHALKRIASVSRRATAILAEILGPMISIPPTKIGFSSENAQCSYYPGVPMTLKEVDLISKLTERCGVSQKNTRIRKVIEGGKPLFEILIASTGSDTDPPMRVIEEQGVSVRLRIVRGDHSKELSQICKALFKAYKRSPCPKKKGTLSNYMRSFQTGSALTFVEAQKFWISDRSPSVESVIGFIEPTRDPYGTRSEWEGVVGIVNREETIMMKLFATKADEFIRTLPWAVWGGNNGKGHFEEKIFKVPDITSLHALTFCASTVWDYDNIRYCRGFKNMLITNSQAISDTVDFSQHYLLPEDIEKLDEYEYHVRFITWAIHELFGHGTGKMLTETSPGRYNFDIHFSKGLPHGLPLHTWYGLGETYTSVFGDLAFSVEECRAILISYYLIHNKDLLELLGFTDSSSPTADELIYYTYLLIGIRGLNALAHYNAESKSWVGHQYRPHYAIFRYLLDRGISIQGIDCDRVAPTITVVLDRPLIDSRGRSAIFELVCNFHIWVCTGDIENCRQVYDELSKVDWYAEALREIVCAHPQPRWKFVQPNTFIEKGKVRLKTYDETDEGIIQSWAERGV
ncbi:Peptidase family M49 [Aspergillus sclerotialis]|uniref:Peptidase family M49 n=1 Tax=Aspergillus sclerotialis TaxID=2070753 RepID=A0A3A2ZK13_9EURO|nr:Peptidase family M49 [Aspergillus sclerotialis]